MNKSKTNNEPRIEFKLYHLNAVKEYYAQALKETIRYHELHGQGCPLTPAERLYGE